MNFFTAAVSWVVPSWPTSAPARTPLQWAIYLVWSLRYAFVVTEMDLPLWGSIALLTRHEDWLFYYLAAFSVPYALYTVYARGANVVRTERALRAKKVSE